tara:strand:+ start:694 stop:1434 length:741 start_codon:yes stop_codon:yes gene_type:complete
MVNRTGFTTALGKNEQFFRADILEERSLKGISSQISSFDGYVFYLIPPSSFGVRPVTTSLLPLFEVLDRGLIRGVLVVSSTGVFSESNGETVDNTTCIFAKTRRVERLLEIEDVWLSSQFQVAIARLGGIYGKGRIIGTSLLNCGESLPGTGQEYLNLIHGYDAAQALLSMKNGRFWGKKFVVTDGSPVQRKIYYDYLADKLGHKRPVFSGDERNSYKCDSQNSWETLRITPKFGDYKTGLGDSFG